MNSKKYFEVSMNYKSDFDIMHQNDILLMRDNDSNHKQKFLLIIILIQNTIVKMASI